MQLNKSILRIFDVRAKEGKVDLLKQKLSDTSVSVVKGKPGNIGYFFGENLSTNENDLVFISIWNNYGSVKVEKEVSKPKNDGPSRTRELLVRFTKFYNDLDAHNDYLYDTQLLPNPKQHIIHALYVGYDESENDEDRKAIKVGLEAIVQFQDLIGDM